MFIRRPYVAAQLWQRCVSGNVPSCSRAKWAYCSSALATAGAFGAVTFLIDGHFPLVANCESKASRREKGDSKVCVCGGSGGIGQPLSLLMALDDNVGELAVYDLAGAMVPPAGVAADLSHLERKTKVKGYAKALDERAIDMLGECLTGCDLVLVPAGMPRKPGQTRDDLFKCNADIAKEVVEACARYCPKAIVALIMNPVNSVVPAMAELYRKKGLDPRKIIGVTTLDSVRANKFVAEYRGINPELVDVPVIGGHAGVTIMPVFSQDKQGSNIPEKDIPALDVQVQSAGNDIVNAKAGKGSATLSMAYAGARLGKAVLDGLHGSPTTECAYVLSDAVEGLSFFTTRVTFGRNGVEKVHGVGSLNEYEKKRLEQACAALKSEIRCGLDYAASRELSS